ncbi:TPA: CPBP family intramembrane metalloprotease [Candidatus Geothermarchaeota archaeon]|nr:CPBP family intramembrane metalloprotease [Candidatus Geothermarchaeota archaeon]HIQ12924.1 CPBP family intramembrane metalloprotease [Thermoprotei archaeon]
MRTSYIYAVIIYLGVATYILNLSFLSLITLDQVRVIENVTDIEVLGIPIFITLFPVLIPIPLTGMELAILLTTLYTLFAIYDLIRKVDGERPLKQVFVLGTVVLVTSILIELIQSSIGIETGMLEAENQYIFFLGAMNAPLSEEIGFRVFIIGLASLIIYLIRAREFNIVEAFISLVEPYKIHNDKTVIYTLYKLVVIQAVLFGFAHLLGGGGWDIGKVTTASIAGLYLGYLFVKYGVTSAVLGHSYFNIYLLTLSFMNYVGVNVGNSYMVVYADTLFIYLLLFGSVYLLIYLYRFVKPRDNGEENDIWSNIDYQTI